jgi:hypothetical protein
MTTTLPAPRFSLNFEEAIRFLGRDRHWFQKIALGAVFSLFSLLIIGGILVQGYLLIFAERVSRAEPDPLPEWEDFGEILRKGTAGFIVSLVYSLPIILLAIISVLVLFVPLALLSASSSRNSGAASGFASLTFLLFMLILIPLIVLTAIIIPAAHAQLVLHDGDLAAAFRLGDVFRFMRRHLGQYALLLLLSYVASSVLNQIGYLACFVGIFVTTFLGQLFQYHLIGQLCWYDRTVLGVPRRGE